MTFLKFLLLHGSFKSEKRESAFLDAGFNNSTNGHHGMKTIFDRYLYL